MVRTKIASKEIKIKLLLALLISNIITHSMILCYDYKSTDRNGICFVLFFKYSHSIRLLKSKENET